MGGTYYYKNIKWVDCFSRYAGTEIILNFIIPKSQDVFFRNININPLNLSDLPTYIKRPFSYTYNYFSVMTMYNGYDSLIRLRKSFPEPF